MLLELCIKLTTGFYGGGKKDVTRNIRTLEKLPNGDIQINVDSWMHKLDSASKDLGLDVYIWDSIKLPVGFIPPTIRILKRKYHSKGIKFDYFEGFGPNTEIHLDVVLLPAEDAPTILQLKKMFHVVGTYYGISPFGSDRFGLGRFNVNSLEMKNM